MKQFLLVLLGTMILCFSSCKEETIPAMTVEVDTDFYPLEVGRTWIYQTDSVVYNKQLNSIDTFLGFVKEEITAEFVAAEDVDTYSIERSFRRSVSDPWIVTDIYSASIIDNRATRNEENLRFVKLVFPTTLGQIWDGNQFFDESINVNVGGEMIEVFKNWGSEVIDVESTEIVKDIQYVNCTVVILADSENSIEKRYAKEIYAKGVGLISRDMIILDTQNSDSSLPILNRAEKGFILSQSLIESY